MLSVLQEILRSAIDFLLRTFTIDVILALIPAFFVAGAIVTFLSRATVLKYLGPSANKPVAYTVATIAGVALTTWSCTVMPLFSGIYTRGAGFGPAIAFLYAAPAINIFVIILALKILGFTAGITWALCSIAFAYILGLLMSFIFREAPQAEKQGAFGGIVENPEEKSLWQQVVLFIILIGILDLLGSRYWAWSALPLLFLLGFLWRYFTKDELLQWLQGTLNLMRILLPWFLIGVLAAALIAAVVPRWLVAPYVGGNSLSACFLAGLMGALMEFCSLSLVPVVKAFTVLGMGNGPSLAVLLTGSAISIPGVLVIRRVMGLKKTLVYAVLVWVLSSLTGYVFGLFVP